MANIRDYRNPCSDHAEMYENREGFLEFKAGISRATNHADSFRRHARHCRICGSALEHFLGKEGVDRNPDSDHVLFMKSNYSRYGRIERRMDCELAYRGEERRTASRGRFRRLFDAPNLFNDQSSAFLKNKKI